MTDSLRETFARVFTSRTPETSASPSVYSRAGVAQIAWWVGFALSAPVVFWTLLLFPGTNTPSRLVTFPLALAGFAAAIAPLTTVPLVGVLRICFTHVSRTRWAILLALVVVNTMASVLFWIFASFFITFILRMLAARHD